MSDPILDSLNEEQKQAVTYAGKHLLVFAGPGTGKTRVITHRIAYLIQRMGMDPESILGITFTNKAAEEMRLRIEKLLAGAVPARPWMGTFHAFANWLLHRHWQEAKLPKGFLIYDRDDQKSLMREILTRHEIPASRGGIYLDVIQRLKDDLMDPKSYAIHANVANDPYRTSISKVYADYQEALRTRGALDFGCLLLEAHALLRDNPQVLEIYRKRFGYVFVDEYQDTNRAQYAMAKLLVGPHTHLTCVGDEDQLIYGWRGADPKNILEFDKEFKDAGSVVLKTNYRSTSEIVETAKRLISNNEARKAKDLASFRGPGRPIELVSLSDDKEEARVVASKITERLAEGVPPSEIAVFYRTNAQSRNFEIEFKMRKIPYRLIGAVGFYLRREVKDVLAFARLLANPKDATSLWRVLANYPTFSVTPDAAAKLKESAGHDGKGLWNAIEMHSRVSTSDLSKKAQGKLAKLLDVYTRLAHQAPSAPVSKILQIIAEETGLLESFEGEEDRVLNIWELVESAASYEESTQNSGLVGLTDFLNHSSLLASAQADNNSQKKENTLIEQTANTVSLMTVHLAKGLEFTCAFVTGLEDGLFPFKTSKMHPEDLEEERRLCYVAMTRAKDRLHLSYAARRMVMGSVNLGQASRFLHEAGLIGEGPWKETKNLRRGARVKHPLFGEGRILSVSGAGEEAKVTINFTEGSTRKFLAKMAPLEILS